MNENIKRAYSRLFVRELKNTTEELPRENPKAKRIFISPTEEHVYKVFLAGTLLEKEEFGQLRRGFKTKLCDGMDCISIIVSPFYNDAYETVAKIEVPAFVCVVGRPSVFEPEPGHKIVTVKAESVHETYIEVRNHWVFETAKRTIERLETIKQKKSSDPESQKIIEFYKKLVIDHLKQLSQNF